MTSQRHADYRPDVDGLRAIAVLAVVAYHGFPGILPGGFVGVDVFFVISGFLISGIIFKSLQQHRFSYLDFYARRIKRIFPALITVLLAGLVAGWFLLLPDQFKSLGKQTIAGAGFAANLLMWQESGYFDVDSQVKPLLHLWSLGVEEQFYLTWPLIIAFLYRHTRHLPGVIGVLLIVSFVVNVALVYGLFHGSASVAFYWPITRFWELLMGALLAYVVTLRQPAIEPSRAASEVMAWIGAVLLAAGILFLTSQRPFPGWWALLPTLGTLLLIASRDAWINRALLSNRWLVYIGLISYPLYLWHWVLLAIARARLDMDGAEAPRIERMGLIALSFVLAWLTYVLVEKPIRFGKHPVLRPVALFWVMVGVAGLGAVVYASDGAAFRYPSDVRPLAAFQYASERDVSERIFRAGRCLLYAAQSFADIAPECTDPPDEHKPLMVLWGDSHAAALYPGLKSLQAHGGNFRIAQFTNSACPPVVGVVLFNRDNCKAFNDDALKKIIALKPDIVLMEGAWWFYRTGPGQWNKLDLDSLRQTVQKVQAAGVRRVVVFGDLPVWVIAQPRVPFKLWLRSGSAPHRTFSYFNQEAANADVAVGHTIAATGAVFVSPISKLCNAQGCLLSTRDDSWTPIAWDEAHLTQAGSEMLVGATASQIFAGKPP